jgi:hypothetical protein
MMHLTCSTLTTTAAASSPRTAIYVLALFILGACGGPIGPFTGGELSGVAHDGILDSWGFAADEEVVQLETQPRDPHSVNIWLLVADGNLYLPTSLISGEEDPTQREWVQHVLTEPSVRLRVGDTIYNATAHRVRDEGTIATVKAAMLAKYQSTASQHSANAWIFRLTPR